MLRCLLELGRESVEKTDAINGSHTSIGSCTTFFLRNLVDDCYRNGPFDVFYLAIVGIEQMISRETQSTEILLNSNKCILVASN